MSQQLTLPDTSRMEAQRPRDLLADALAWIDMNAAAWLHITTLARIDAERLHYIRVKHAIEDVRGRHLTGLDHCPVKLPNAFSAPFGRILAAWYPELAEFIPLGRSKVDGCPIPPVPPWASQL